MMAAWHLSPASPDPFTATRYHSLIVDRLIAFGCDFEISAWTRGG